MKKLAVIIAALTLAGCAHQGSSARYESGSGSSMSSTQRMQSPAYYAEATWDDLEVDVEPNEHIAAPTAADYIRGLELAEDEPSVAQQLDPGSDINITVEADDPDASAPAETGIGGAAGAEVGTSISGGEEAAVSSSFEKALPDVEITLQPEDDLPTSSEELPGAEARQQDIPAVFAPKKDNHPDLTDAPSYPEAFQPENAAGRAAGAESGEGSSEAVDVRIDVDESDFTPPLSGGVPSDGSSGQLNSGSSVDRTSPEEGSVSTSLGVITETDKDLADAEASSAASIEAEASGAPASSQRGSQSGGESNANPDRDLTDRVYRQLHSNPPGQLTEDNLRNIEIKAQNGVVSLSGAVDTESEKAMLEQRVFRIEGVYSVKNNVTVGRGSSDNLPKQQE